MRHLSIGALSLAAMLAFFASPDRADSQATDDSSVWAQDDSCAVESIPAGFTSQTAEVNGVRLHYVVGGEGPAVILIHGFPQNWSAWAKTMPRLASQFRVVAVDLRGIGGSEPTQKGYDAATMVEDVHELAETLELESAYVAGSDFGGWVAYALARLHPDGVRGAMIIDVPLPGVDPWSEVKADPALWHFGFHQAPGLAERLLAGREAIYIEHFLRTSVADPQSISDEDVRRYACAYSKPGRMEAAMRMYRAFEASESFGRERRGALDVPVMLVGGEESFGPLLPKVAAGLRAAGVSSVQTETIADAGHYLADEKPAETAMLIEHWAAAISANGP